jgi:SAM-dependent methyltransferase
MSFSNVYDDSSRAEAYAKLEFPGTYYLAFRDIPSILSEHVTGREALDFGCGAGRSTRFLKSLGFHSVGIDISDSMIRLATSLDPDGEYVLVKDGDYGALRRDGFDLVFSAFAFDNIPGVTKRTEILSGLKALLNPSGRIVILGSTPDIYTHEWASFTTRQFSRNFTAKSGDEVCTVMKDVDDKRPVVDVIWFHEDYLELFAASGLQMIAQYKPLGHPEEPYEWLSETSVAPWVIYVLGPCIP